ncbi:hypothetical protein TSACC_156 [Terrimicrobium sacchariphilum]|uniref:Uncharacterized protein n=1 Tax=Terrimicrobium sacchariphilum TaxID=690879 RepID=A0A146G3S8_TERSA|nr:hypothetical protein [Terrimicrobium sacchariphilum]GAT31508.1 hypothetical protein TSACC_156 [Terrimicrobium sacchariphilum]
MPIRNHLDIVGHRKFDVAEVLSGMVPINNILIDTGKPDDEWLKKSTELIAEWRAIFRSIYIKWALALNGLDVAVEKYSAPAWQAKKRFFVTSLRTERSGLSKITEIADWNGGDAAANHQSVIPYIAGWGIIDLGSALEEFIFDLYRIFLWQHTEHLTQGAEFKNLRRLRTDAMNSPQDLAKWEEAFAERLDNWQRNAVYKSKRELFLAYCNHAGLKTPSIYKHTTLETWADCLNGVCILRNCLIHPNAKVPKELGDFSASKLNIGYDFKEGHPLQVTLQHLQCTECFLDQLLTGLNFSFVERTGVRLPETKNTP